MELTLRLFLIQSIIGWSVLVVGLNSCTLGNCRRTGELIHPKDQMMTAGINGVEKGTMKSPPIDGKPMDRHVFVYQQDGSLQCTPGSGLTSAQMAQKLKGIKIYSQEKKSDGFFHIQACGSPTGINNVYEISEKDLEKAKQLKFKEWTF